MFFKIGNVALAFVCKSPIVFCEPPFSIYHDFLHTREDLPPDAVLVDLIAGWPAAFETLAGDRPDEQRGVIFRRSPGHLLLGWRSRLQGEQFLWWADWPEASARVAVHYNEHFVRKVDGRQQIAKRIYYPLIQLLLSAYLATHRGALHHAVAACHAGRAWIFAARSGVGKSTLAKLLAQHPAFEVINDDRVISRLEPDGYHVYGTPWRSTAGVARNVRVPLAGFFFLHQAPEHRIEPLPPRTALARLMPVTDIAWPDADLSRQSLDYCSLLLGDLTFHDLHFKPTADVADVLDRFLAVPDGVAPVTG